MIKSNGGAVDRQRVSNHLPPIVLLAGESAPSFRFTPTSEDNMTTIATIVCSYCQKIMGKKPVYNAKHGQMVTHGACLSCAREQMKKIKGAK